MAEIEAVRHAAAAAFLARAEPWLLEREAEHNLILGLAYARRARGEQDPDEIFATLESSGRVVGCAFRTPPHKLGLTRMPFAAVGPLIELVRSTHDSIPAVLGPPDVAEPAAAIWTAATGTDWAPGMRQRIYRLDEVRHPSGVPGVMRPAGEDDLALVHEWAEGFADELGSQFRVGSEAVDRWLQRGALFMWDDAGAVSMTVAHGRTPRGVRVSFVYTPPERRGRGYASGLVAAVSERMLASGLDFCVLYTDLSNPTSNSIYRRVGYEPIADVVDCDIVEV